MLLLIILSAISPLIFKYQATKRSEKALFDDFLINILLEGIRRRPDISLFFTYFFIYSVIRKKSRYENKNIKELIMPFGLLIEEMKKTTNQRPLNLENSCFLLIIILATF